MPSTPRPLSDGLRQAVLRTGKTISAVARESGVPQPVLHRFMAGQRGLNLDTADRLCAYLGLGLTTTTADSNFVIWNTTSEEPQGVAVLPEPGTT